MGCVVPAPRDPALLVRAARLYYEDQRSQQEVAEALKLSRSNVSRLLAAAREQGIVEIRINDPSGRDLALEAALAAAFELADCRVASVRPGQVALAAVGRLGAEWLLGNVRPGQRVSLSWGQTLQAMVEAVHPERALAVEVAPLVGGLSSVASETTGEELVRELAGRLGAKFKRLHAPALLESKAARDTLLLEPAIASVLDAGRRSSVSFVGVGAYGWGASAAIIEALRLDDAERARFEAAGPVGDLCARFFDDAGRSIAGVVDDRVLGVSLGDLRRIPTVVGLAAGIEKCRGLLGALRGGYLDVLVCDSALAQAVIEAAER